MEIKLSTLVQSANYLCIKIKNLDSVDFNRITPIRPLYTKTRAMIENQFGFDFEEYLNFVFDNFSEISFLFDYDQATIDTIITTLIANRKELFESAYSKNLGSDIEPYFNTKTICDCVIPKPIDAYDSVDKHICKDCNGVIYEDIEEQSEFEKTLEQIITYLQDVLSFVIPSGERIKKHVTKNKGVIWTGGKYCLRDYSVFPISETDFSFLIRLIDKTEVSSISLADPKLNYLNTSAREVKYKTKRVNRQVSSLKEAKKIIDKFFNQ